MLQQDEKILPLDLTLKHSKNHEGKDGKHAEKSAHFAIVRNGNALVRKKPISYVTQGGPSVGAAGKKSFFPDRPSPLSL